MISPYFSSDFVTLLCGKRSSPSNEVPREKKRKEKKPHKKKEVSTSSLKESNRNEDDMVATTQVILLELDHFGEVLSKMSIFFSKELGPIANSRGA